MAVLSDADREEIRSEFVRLGIGDLALAKADIRAAVDALDNFLEANKVAINNAFPEPFKTEATAQMKAYVVELCARKRRVMGS